MTIEVGIVGAGNRGHVHADAYSDVDGADVVGVADVDQEAATTPCPRASWRSTPRASWRASTSPTRPTVS